MTTSLQKFWSNPNYRIATIIATCMILWFASGIFASDAPPMPEPSPGQVAANRELPSVRARHIQSQSYPLNISLNGRTEANRAVDLRAEVSGQIESLPVEKGSVVKAGDVICQIAVEDRALRVTEAEANVEQAQLEYDGALRLKTGGYQSQTAIATAKARLETAKANLARRQLDLQKTAIRAPFAGVVNTRPVEIGGVVRVGDSCATLLDLDPLLLTAQVSEQEVAGVADDGVVTARLITGEVVTGSIRYISRQSENITRTYRIEAEVDNSDQRLIAGVTAELDVLIGEVEAHLVPASLLVLGDGGDLQLRVLDDDNIVQTYPVNLVGDDGNGVWVSGLPTSTRLITVGHHYVSVGDKVQIGTVPVDADQAIAQ